MAAQAYDKGQAMDLLAHLQTRLAEIYEKDEGVQTEYGMDAYPTDQDPKEIIFKLHLNNTDHTVEQKLLFYVEYRWVNDKKVLSAYLIQPDIQEKTKSKMKVAMDGFRKRLDFGIQDFQWHEGQAPPNPPWLKG